MRPAPRFRHRAGHPITAGTDGFVLPLAGRQTQVAEENPARGIEDRLRLLDGFSIPIRYLDSYPEGTPGEHFGRLQSEKGLLHAIAIIEWIRAALAQLRERA